ncbi:hypothetical protein RJ40_00725 [Methanofollis aquaemaris]|uniref:Uncharacterized protein n=1 Tax=Methanofollis aquaemaris TaxID=126734 RepID=A0A8A3S099_9EURY|nr:hypothetical protein [Methanofollis aquaemaris]QSZ66127.1 hypothetical protein RJ40_00725 [Methanofollis aquaemaris]
MRRTFFTTVCIAALFIVLVLCATPVSADPGWVTTSVSENTTDALGGKISGEYIISLAGAEEIDCSQNRIYLHAVQTGERTIIGSPSANMMVTGPDISAEYAVWFETPIDDFGMNETSTAPSRVYLYSLRNGSAEIIDAPGTAEWPKIDGGRIIWLGESADLFNIPIFLYDIGTGKSEQVCELPVDDPAGVLFDGDHIAYLNSEGLYLYSLETRTNTTIFRNVFGNKSGSHVESYALGGDYLIYLKHTVTFEGPDKGTFDELYLYLLSTREKRLLDPATGTFLEPSKTPAEDKKDLKISSPFTDGERIGWIYSENTPGSTILLCDPEAGTGEKISVDGQVDDPFLDGDRMVWVETHFPSFHGDLIYAQKSISVTETVPASAPGFGTGIGIVALLTAMVLLAGRRTKP